MESNESHAKQTNIQIGICKGFSGKIKSMLWYINTYKTIYIYTYSRVKKSTRNILMYVEEEV